MKVTALWRYPIKSCRGTQHNSLVIGKEGFIGDRRYQWVLDNGRFVTQREFPQLSQISARIENETLYCQFEETELAIENDRFTERTEVSIWNDLVTAHLYSGELNKVVSDFIGLSVRLVYLPELGRPITDRSATGHVSFADGLPYLLTTEQSLTDLNERLVRPVKMLNFRPNIVVDGTLPYGEDDWQAIKIGRVVFRNVKPCKRCVLTTIDPDTGTRASDAEPLKTLATYRQPEPGSILFGINLIAEGEGEIAVGDAITLV